jgi:DNA-binding MarR family transcriptional regulator
MQKEFELSIPQFLFIYYLYGLKDQKASYKDFMEFLSLNSSTVTGIVTRLEKRGFIERIASDIDKRSKLISLTGTGVEVVNQIIDDLDDPIFTKLDELSAEEVKLLNDSLNHLISIISH